MCLERSVVTFYYEGWRFWCFLYKSLFGAFGVNLNAIWRSRIIYYFRLVFMQKNKKITKIKNKNKVTISQRSLLNKLHVCGKIFSCHKTPLRDGFHSNNALIRGGAFNLGTPYLKAF